MTTHIHSSSRRILRRSIVNAALIVTLALLALALQSSAAAQPAASPSPKVNTAIIPLSVDPNQSNNANFDTRGAVVLRFQAPTLLKGATVVRATLQLLCSDMMDSADGTVIVNLDPSTVFGSKGFNSATPGVGQPVFWNATREALTALNAKPGASFQLQLVPSQAARGWYSIAAESKLRPRLILEYTVPGPAVVLTESLPATHSPTLFLPNPPAGAQFTSRIVANIWSYAPVSYKGLLHVVTQNQLQALPALGGPPVWSLPVSGAGQHLLLSDSGRVYIVGVNQILAYQLDPSNAATPPTIAKTAGGQPLSPKSVPNLNPTLAPAVGPDGGLYFVNGQEVYGLNPDLQELWKVTLDATKTSRITVSPSGQFVYLLGTKGGVTGLIAIDARTGDVFTASLPNSAQLNDNSSLHAPVVLVHPDGTEKIYVAANSLDSGVLAAFDNPKTTIPGRDKNIVATEHWKPSTGLFSQPTAFVSDTRKIYSVQVTGTKGQLMAIDWLNGKATLVGTDFPVAKSAYLRNGGNLAVDKTGNVLVWNGAEAKLYAFAPGGASGVAPGVVAGPTADVPGPTADTPLLFGSDGTLYAPGPANANDRALKAILPQYMLVDSANSTISSPTHLRVLGTANNGTTLSAGGSVFLGPEFKVKQGGTLTIRTNVPQ